MVNTHQMRGVQIVYVFEHIATGSFKIGFTSQFPGWRLMSVAGKDAVKHNLLGPWRIVALMPGTEANERGLHKAFAAHKHSRGNEWFKPCDEIRLFVLSVPYIGEAGATLRSWLGYASDGGQWAKLSSEHRMLANDKWSNSISILNRQHIETAFVYSLYSDIAKLPQHKRHKATHSAMQLSHASIGDGSRP